MAEDNSDEEGTAETKSESIGSDDEADEEGDDEDDEDPSRRLNVRTGMPLPLLLSLSCCTEISMPLPLVNKWMSIPL